MLEKLIEILTALVAAINANTAALKAAPAAKAPKGGTTADKPAETAGTTGGAPALTVTDVRAAAQALLDANGNDGSALTELNKKYGTKRLTEAPAEKFAEIVAALKELATKAKAGADNGI